jgi:hypothetical protein
MVVRGGLLFFSFLFFFSFLSEQMSSAKKGSSAIGKHELVDKLNSKSMYDRTTALAAMLQLTQESSGTISS